MNAGHWLRAAGALAAIALLALPAQAGSTDTAKAAVQQRVTQLLHDYAANRPAAVLAMLDPHGFVVYGSDVAEVVRTPREVRELMANDFKLWHTATFGTPANMDIRVVGDMASAFFDVPFSAGGRPPITVRFCTVWRERGGKWMLVQSANAVPTVGASARALTHAARAQRRT